VGTCRGVWGFPPEKFCIFKCLGLDCRHVYRYNFVYISSARQRFGPHIIVLFVETPRKFITAVIHLRGVSTNKTIIYVLPPCMQTYKELIRGACVMLLCVYTHTGQA
jgi:hypothetical protein